MAVAKPIHRLTPAEYLEIERRAEVRSEFFDGEMFAMSGGTRWHSLIAVNLSRELSARLRGKPCVTYNTDLRVKVEASGLYTYPDLSVVCGEQQFEDAHSDTLLNPIVVIEVLSESRELYDRGEKFRLYRQIPSLREYLLVSQWEPYIEQYYLRAPGGDWILRDVFGLQSQLSLPSLGIAIPLAEIFANVDFPPTTAHHHRPTGS